MEVILLTDVKNVGKKNQVVKVSDGYARNFIFKKNLGVIADKKNLEELNIRIEKEKADAKQLLDEATVKKKEIEALTVKLSIKVGEGGRSFGSISTKEICEGLLNQHKVEIDKRKIVLDNPIKEVGNHVVAIKLHPEVAAQLKVIVEGE